MAFCADAVFLLCSLFPARSDGTFEVPLVIPALPTGLTTAASGDFDADGRADLVVNSGAVLFQGRSDRQKWKKVLLPLSGAAVRAMDVDGDAIG